MKRENPRAHRLADQIQRELSDLLRSEVKDPRVGQVTITGIDVSADFSRAKVRVTHLAGRDQSSEALEGLRRAAGFLRSQLAQRLSVFTVPQLVFEYDDSIEAGIRLSSLIDQAIAEDRKHDS